MQPTAQQVIDAIQAHNYALGAVLALIALVAIIRKIAPKIHGATGAFLNSDRGGSLLVLVTGVLGAEGASLAAGKHLSLALVVGGVVTAATASGGWNMVWDIFWPEDKKAAPTLAETVPPAGPTKAAVFIPLLLIPLLAVSSCGTAGGQALGKCELNYLPQTEQTVGACVVQAASGQGDAQAAITACGISLGLQQFTCLVQAVVAWAKGADSANRSGTAGDHPPRHQLAAVAKHARCEECVRGAGEPAARRRVVDAVSQHKRGGGPMKVQLINHVGPEHDRECSLIADVLQQYDELISVAHGLAASPVVFTPGATVAPDGFNPMGAFLNPDIAGALGYHDIDPKGRAYGKAFLSLIPKQEMLHDASGTGQSLAAVLAHEYAEMKKDELANAWRQLQVTDPESGRVYSMVAEELADWVQNFAFTLKAHDGTLVDCSDFVFPQFFNSKAQKGDQLSYMGTVSTPGEVAPQCYGIVADIQSEGQVLAAHARPSSPKRIFHATEKPPAWREAMQGHEAGRTTRRLKQAT